MFSIEFVYKCALTVFAAEAPRGKEYTNSIGMRLVRIEPGTFSMGVGKTPLPDEVADKPYLRNGDFDEQPTHKVKITKPFYMGVYEVTNAQYEQFDPEHRKLRGKLGFSKDDDEAVVFASWHDAMRFCEWLSEKDGLPYRLPTEAEWEYACRAGTTTHFHTGDTLPEVFYKNAQRSWYPDSARSIEDEVVSLLVGQTTPNAWGLYDMHGNVEEWCHDWYGLYEANEQVDPVGRVDGNFKVTRGGSHGTEIYYLRSANRMGTLPEDKSWMIGFRVVLGELPKTEPLPVPPPELYQRDVEQEVPSDITKEYDPTNTDLGLLVPIVPWEGEAPAEPLLKGSAGASPSQGREISTLNRYKPYFKGPRKYVKIPPDSNGPMFSRHNHDPALVACPNGDLLAIWYTCVEEPGRELSLLASRLRYGEEEWEPASPFWDAPDRNCHAPALFFDGKDTIYQFSGLSAAATWGNLATTMRTSKDNGATWSRARLIIPEHGTRHMPVESVFRAQDGSIVLPCDAVTGGSGGTAIWVSRDEGETWQDAGGTIAGIHAGVVQLKACPRAKRRDGRLMAFGRGDNIDGMMPKSISTDMGKTWAYSASPFPPISGGQRLVLLRLKEGPIFFASFFGSRREPEYMSIIDASGKERLVTGLFGALSFDEGETWPCIRLISDDGPGREVETMDGRLFTMGFSSAEPGGYMSVCQAADGIIHLISSRQHYAFNLEWLKKPPPAEPTTPLKKKGSNSMDYDGILQTLKFLSNPKAVKGMAKYGITPESAYGVSIPNLRKMAKQIGVDHHLAQQLWASDIRETRILASMVDDPNMVTEEQMEKWVKDFDYWEICDQCCMKLFAKTKFAYQKCIEWSSREEEFVKRAGFVLMARLAVSDKKADDEQFERFFPMIKNEASDRRHYVKKGINWALRQIGKRNLNLNRKAIETAKEIQKIDSRNAKWIASNVIQELT